MDKKEIHNRVLEIINERIFDSKFGMDAAQEAANNEGKSSAGDKYETGRAMGQIEVNRYGVQLQNANNELSIVQKIDFNVQNKIVALGSLVETTAGLFYISVSIGSIKINEKSILIISQQSPIGLVLKGKNTGDTFEFMKKQHKIISIK